MHLRGMPAPETSKPHLTDGLARGLRSLLPCLESLPLPPPDLLPGCAAGLPRRRPPSLPEAGLSWRRRRCEALAAPPFATGLLPRSRLAPAATHDEVVDVTAGSTGGCRE